MPIIYRIDHTRRVVIARGYGTLTDNDFFSYQREAWSGTEVAGYNELVDMTHALEIKLPSMQRIQDLASVAAHMDPPSTSARLAIVAPGDLAYGLGRVFQTYRELHKQTTKEVALFRTLSDALAFLNVSPSVPLPPLPPGTTTEGQS